MSCYVCKGKIANTQPYFELNCGQHLAHSSHKTIRCPCLNVGATIQKTATTTPDIPATRTQNAVDEAVKARRLLSAERAKQPLCPPQRGVVGSLVGSVLRTGTWLADRSKPDTESSDPLVLLSTRMPLEEIRDKHGLDITELINDHGVNINDFFKNGYTVGDMCNAFSSRMNTTDGMDVLYYLGIDAEHFRVCPDMVQPEVIRSKLGYDPRMLMKLGYQYTPDSPWTLPQMVRVGLTMSMVMEAGLVMADDWARLKSTATSPTQLVAFGVTSVLESQLRSTPAPREEAHQQPMVQQQPSQAASPVYYAQPAHVAKATATQTTPQGTMPQKIIVPGVTVSHEELEVIRRSREPVVASKYSGPKLVNKSPFQLVVIPRE